MAALWYSTLDANEQREGRQENMAKTCKKARAITFIQGGGR